MGWLYMLASGAAGAVFFNQEPKIGFYIAIAVLAVSFATFCLLYDEPVKRAALRVRQRLATISNKGIRAEEYQRLQSRSSVVTVDDRKFRLSFLSVANVASGVAGAVLLVWALIARIM
jgi:hypothetical protein